MNSSGAVEEMATRIVDRSAFRSVFATPEERLILVLTSEGSSTSAKAILEVARKLSRSGLPVRWLILGGGLGMDPLHNGSAGDAGLLHHLDSWAVTLLPEVMSLVDVLVLTTQDPAWGASSLSTLPSETPILRAKGEERGDASRSSRTWGYDPLSPSSFEQALLECLHLSEDLPRSLHTHPSESSIPLTDPVQKRADPRTSPRAGTGEFILYNDWGIGDELLLSAVAREIKRTWPKVRLWIRSRYGFSFPSFVSRGQPPREAQLVETIYQNATMYGPQFHSPFPGHLVQQMLDKFTLDTGLLVRAEDVRPELTLPGDVGSKPRPRSVVLHSRPNPRLPSKDWGIGRWIHLSELLHAAGVRITQVGGAEEDLLPHAEDLRGLPFAQVTELVAGAGATVCLVGFLMHLSQATRTPAVVIYGGREHPAIDGYPDQVHLASGPLPCRGRWGCHLGPDLECPHAMKCMEELTPELVAGEVLALLDSGDEEGRA